MAKIPLRHIDSVKIMRVEHLLSGKDMVQPLHRHSFYYILALRKAAGEHSIDFVPFPVTDSCVFLLRPGQVHQLTLKEGSTGYLLQFGEDFYPALQRPPALQNSPGQLFSRSGHRSLCTLDAGRSKKLFSILAGMWEEYEARQERYQDVIRAGLEVFFIELWRQCPRTPALPRTPPSTGTPPPPRTPPPTLTPALPRTPPPALPPPPPGTPPPTRTPALPRTPPPTLTPPPPGTPPPTDGIGGEGAEGTGSHIQERLEALLALIERHIATHKEVAFYAGKLRLTPYQLNATTKTALGKTCSEVIDAHVVLEAKRYLLATSNQVKQIAGDLGYEDVSYFIRFFRKHTGYSPESFRQHFG
ncbi:MAG TPA: helix-turn-helix transcriptional regulator [Puia sp.]|nr:helix-turn-helix transcriptional regulator [Puia sp.]